MDSDYKPSKKYTKDQLDNLDISYKFRDFCQDHYAQFISCGRTHSVLLENKFMHSLYLSQKQWEKCQKYRQLQVLKQLQQIFRSQRN